MDEGKAGAHHVTCRRKTWTACGRRGLREAPLCPAVPAIVPCDSVSSACGVCPAVFSSPDCPVWALKQGQPPACQSEAEGVSWGKGTLLGLMVLLKGCLQGPQEGEYGGGGHSVVGGGQRGTKLGTGVGGGGVRLVCSSGCLKLFSYSSPRSLISVNVSVQ